MNSNDNYTSVLIAALLHDIGKFVQRGGSEKLQHPSFSAIFVEANKQSFHDPDTIKTLAEYHHEWASGATDKHPKNISDPMLRMMAYLVSRADNFSSGERSQEKVKGYNLYVPLDSIFPQVSLPGKSDAAPSASDKSMNPPRYALSRIYTKRGDCFPSQDIESLSREDYEQYMDFFITEFKELFPKPYEGMVDTMSSLIYKYLWCVPSDTTTEPHDVSLADHLRTTCAIAACFYKYHDENGWDEESVTNDNISKSLLVCGDISGIQRYIYDIASIGEGGVAKRLRGRSFKISLLTDMIALRIIKKLDLPLACRIMSAGGRFDLLIPNTETAKRILADEMAAITDWMYEEYTGELSVCYAFTELIKENYSGNFNEALKRTSEELAKSKMRKFENIFNSDRALFDINFNGRRACTICDRQPTSVSDEFEEDEPCDKCELDKMIGEELVKDSEWLIYSHDKIGDCSIPFMNDWYANIVPDLPRNDSDVILACNLRGGKLTKTMPSAFFIHAGYVPTKSQKNDNYKTIKNFSELAEEPGKYPLLGVMRADVDNLGMIFSSGLPSTQISISRLSTMSNMLNAFFSFELTKMLEDDFPSIYTAYAGGDDLMLVGYWEDLIDLSKEVQKEFSRFTGNNPNITISAGIGTFDRKSPIAITSVQTEEILERSKDGGRDSLTIFDTTFKWADFDDVSWWAHKFISEIQRSKQDDHQNDNDRGGMSTSFLYRLLGYQLMARNFYSDSDEQKTGKSALFKPRLAYDIARNYITSDGRAKIDPDLHKGLLSLLDSNDKTRKTWRLMKASVTWASYATRKGGND